MRKTVFFLLILSVAFFCMSCAENNNVCYYGYFSDTAFVLAYNGKKNTLYYVNIPIDTIVKWGLEEGIDYAPDAVRNFAGAEENGFILGDSRTLEACREVLDSFSDEETKDVNSRVKVLADKAGDFVREPLLSNVNRLCATDMSVLFKAMAGKNAKVEIMNPSVVLNGDIPFNRSYFRTWLAQIIK